MELQYRKGKQHVNADFISRLEPCNRGPTGEACIQCANRMLGHPRKDTSTIRAVGRTEGVNCASASRITRSGRVPVSTHQPGFDYSVGRSQRTRFGNASTWHRLPTKGEDKKLQREVGLPQQSNGSDQSGASGTRSGIGSSGDRKRTATLEGQITSGSDSKPQDGETSVSEDRPPNKEDALNQRPTCLGEAPEKDDSESKVDDNVSDVGIPHLASILDSALSSDMVQNDMGMEEHWEENVAEVTCPHEDRTLRSTRSGAERHRVSPNSARNNSVSNFITTADSVGSQPDNRTKRKSKIISQLERRAPIAVACGAQQWDHQFLMGEQLADPDVEPVRNALVKGELKPDEAIIQSSSPSQRALWKQWDSLVIFEGVMYREFVEANGKVQCYQLVLPSSLKMPFLEMIHADKAAHLKYDKCEQMIQQSAYWLTWRRDLKWFILCCSKCQAYHEGRPPRQAFLRPLIHGEPRERWSVDLCGPFRTDRSGNQYLFTAVDCFTRFAVIVPIKNKEAVTVANCIYREIFLRHGFAHIQADRGTEFRNQLLDALVQVTGHRKLHTTSYHAASNGKVERLHRTFNGMLAKFVSESQKDWSDYVPELTFCYNACAHRSTGLSPFYLMYGQNPRWNLDLVLGNPSASEDYDSLPEYVVNLVKRLEKAYHHVRKQLHVVAETSKCYYDRSV